MLYYVQDIRYLTRAKSFIYEYNLRTEGELAKMTKKDVEDCINENFVVIGKEDYEDWKLILKEDWRKVEKYIVSARM